MSVVHALVDLLQPAVLAWMSRKREYQEAFCDDPAKATKRHGGQIVSATSSAGSSSGQISDLERTELRAELTASSRGTNKNNRERPQDIAE
jgi:hypothetical protein